MSIRSHFSRTRRIERQASRWVMLMLDDPQRYSNRVKRWMERNPEHRATYSRIVAEVGRAGNAARLLPELQEFASRKPAPPAWRAHPHLALAALAGLAVMGVLVFHRFDAEDRRPAHIAVTDISNSEPGEKHIVLGDGTRVTLFGSTRLAVRFGPGERSIILVRGKARFDVSHDASRPFVVSARGGSVTALGTLFEVQVGQTVEVHLLRGRVRVTMPETPSARTRREVVLAPGEHVSFTPDPNTDAVNSGSAPTTAAGNMSGPQPAIRTFDDVPVSSVIAAFNRQSETKIELVDPAVGQERIFAEINFLNADSVARKLAEILGLSIDRGSPGRLRLVKPN